MKDDDLRCIPTAFSVPRGIVREFRAACDPPGTAGETASQVVTRLLREWLTKQRRRNGAREDENR